MKKNVKRIINLIVIFLIAIAMYVFLRNIPSTLVGKTINKIGEELKATVTKNFDSKYNPYEGGNSKFTSKSFSMDNRGLYLDFDYDGNPLYCVHKGASLTKKGGRIEDLEEIGEKILKVKTSYKNSENSALEALNKQIEDMLKSYPNVIYKTDPESLGSKEGFLAYGTYIYYYEMTGDYEPRQANAEESYILTYQGDFSKDYDKFCAVRQEAIWQTESLRYKNGSYPALPAEGSTKYIIRKTNKDNADAMKKQAENYQDFIDKIAQRAEEKKNEPDDKKIENQKRLAQKKLEQERMEKEKRLEQERLEQERFEKQKLEQERLVILH